MTKSIKKPKIRNFEITADQRAALDRDKRFLAICGEPHTDDDAWRLQDAVDHINIMQKMCLRYDAFFQLACNGDGWMVSALKTVDGEIIDLISVIVETNPWGAPLLCRGIRKLADTVHDMWQPVDRDNVLQMHEFRG
jgi:hypothetical protein